MTSTFDASDSANAPGADQRGAQMTRSGTAAGANLVVCPQCDALYRDVVPAAGELAVCARCHYVIAAPRRKAGMQIISLSIANLAMMMGAIFFPFLRIEAAGLANSASVLDFALAFSGERFAILVIITAAAILVIPAMRTMLILYVLVPLVFDRPPARRARAAFRLSEELKPWSMAEIFALGCAISLIKISDLATVAFGPAFWMFIVVVILALFQQRYLCSRSVWDAIDASAPAPRGAPTPSPDAAG